MRSHGSSRSRGLAGWAGLIGWAVLVVVSSSTLPAAGNAEAVEAAAPEVQAPEAPVAVVTAREDLAAVFQKQNPASLADLESMEQHVQALLEKVSPAVVAVRVWGSSGSGVVISEDGLVLSAAHVLDEPNREAHFTFPDGRRVRGITLGTNHGIDAGLMRITEEGPWPHVEIADLSGMKLGDWVLALGHPGGFDGERAIVARFGRVIRFSSIGLQTDCTLTGGDSGGPLFDMHGRVVGIHSRVSHSHAGNFHVPVSTYVNTWDRLAKGENWGTRRAYFGIRGRDHPDGVEVERVINDTPASNAGVMIGDILMEINGQRMKDFATFLDYLSRSDPGDELAVTIQRGAQELSVLVTVEPWRCRR